MNKELYIKCNCGKEVLNIVRYWDSTFISIYDKHYKQSFFSKIKFILNFIRTGNPFCDQIILDKDQVKELQVFLKQIGKVNK